MELHEITNWIIFICLSTVGIAITSILFGFGVIVFLKILQQCVIEIQEVKKIKNRSDDDSY